MECQPRLVVGFRRVTPGHRVDIHVEAANEPTLIREAVARARPAWERLRSSELSFHAAVAGQLTKAHNEFCDPEDEVTPEQFAARLRLLSARFQATGAVELIYNDGMLLGGHWIVMPVQPDGSVGEAVEAG